MLTIFKKIDVTPQSYGYSLSFNCVDRKIILKWILEK
jgi:hypothetical protein